jgi:transglutaminase-like putative cysteine protease
MTLEDAVALLRESHRRGWDLVAEAQRLVARRMIYSRRNTWDSPARAFERGMGYCHQKALALHAILTSLGIESRPVAARRCRFPATRIHEYTEPEQVSGHVWLRVSIDGREEDVCPGEVANSPGHVSFTVLSRTREYRGLRRLGGQLGSIVLNWTRDRAGRRRGYERG